MRPLLLLLTRRTRHLPGRRRHTPDGPLNYKSSEAAQEAADQAEADYKTANPVQQQKQKPPPKSGYFGVYPLREKWMAQINYGGKQHNLGVFDTKEQAAQAYDQAARQHAPDRPLNFPIA